MTDLLATLERTLGGTYTFEREIVGGSMSRVFLAMDRTLRRRCWTEFGIRCGAIRGGTEYYELRVSGITSLGRANPRLGLPPPLSADRNEEPNYAAARCPLYATRYPPKTARQICPIGFSE